MSHASRESSDLRIDVYVQGMRNLVSVKELADAFGLTVQAVRAAIADDRLPARKTGKTYEVNPSDAALVWGHRLTPSRAAERSPRAPIAQKQHPSSKLPSPISEQGVRTGVISKIFSVNHRTIQHAAKRGALPHTLDTDNRTLIIRPVDAAKLWGHRANISQYAGTIPVKDVPEKYSIPLAQVLTDIYAGRIIAWTEQGAEVITLDDAEMMYGGPDPDDFWDKHPLIDPPIMDIDDPLSTSQYRDSDIARTFCVDMETLREAVFGGICPAEVVTQNNGSKIAFIRPIDAAKLWGENIGVTTVDS